MFGRKQKEIDKLKYERQVLRDSLARRERQRNVAMFLLEGCRKHPSYRAINKPTANCVQCQSLYASRKELNEHGLAIRKRNQRRSY